MKCPLCAAKMVEGTTNLVFNLREEQRIIVVLDVPALICDQCGEEFVPLESAQKVESLVRKSEEGGIKMGFLTFSQAA
jgi:YgiT-type zinc finger domain-containing protein